MNALALVVGLIAVPAGPTIEAPKTVTVRFASGPVVVSHGIRPYLAAGFRVAERTEQPLMQFQNHPKPKTAPKRIILQPPKRGQSRKWIRFEAKSGGDF
jgi:hypothetical protein